MEDLLPRLLNERASRSFRVRREPSTVRNATETTGHKLACEVAAHWACGLAHGLTPPRARRLDIRAEGTGGSIKITQKPGVELCGYSTFMATKRIFYFCVFHNYVQILFLSNLWSTSQKGKQPP